MWRLTVNQVLARRFRLALTVLAVVLGVTFVAGTLVLTDTSQRLFDEQFRTATAGVDLTVRDAAAFDSAMGVEVERDPLPADLAERIRQVPGVRDARPVARGQGLLRADGKAIVPSGPSLLTSWQPAPFGAFTVRAGRPPAGDDEVVIDAATAEQHRIDIGETVTVQAGRTEQLRVVGLAGFGDRPGLPNTTVALVALPTAQRLLDLGTTVSEVLVVAADDVATPRLRDRLDARLGPAFAVSASQDSAAASAAAAKNKLAYVQVMLLALAGAALLVGAFLIANTFSIVITQRTGELAVLRAAGATGRQVVTSVLGEALLVGITASAVGTGLGVAAAIGLRDLVGAFGVALPGGGIVVTARTIVVAMAIGVLVTVLSAVAPARRAARVAPVEAMRHSAAGPAAGRTRAVFGGVAAALAAAALIAVLAGAGPTVLLAPGGLLAVVGLVLLGPALVPRLAGLIGRPLDVGGVPGRLARESAGRAPRRTAATALALALGLALITFMTIVGASIKGSIRDTYQEVVTADYVIESARGEMLGGLSPHVHHRISELPQVAIASRLRFGHWKDGDATSALTAVDPATLAQVTRLDMVEGRLDALASGDGIILSESVARQRGLAIGDRLPMTFSRTATQRLPVVGLLADDDARALSTDYVISLDTYARHFSENVDAAVYVRVADAVQPGAARSAMQRVLADHPTAELRDQAAAVAARTSAVDQIMGLVTALLLLAVLIAVLGITNTLALSIVERTRELGLLRSVGMTRGQLRWMVRGEAVLVAALAVVLGVGVGVAFGAAAVAALGRTAPVPLALPVGQLLLVVVVATVAGLLAGLLPARRAARLDVLAAIGAP